MDSIYANLTIKSMIKIENAIKNLKYMPKLYKVIKRYPELNMEYRRIIIDKYILLYTISEKEKKIYIVHMYYGKSNYLMKI